ncbi:MAG: hypothetical protein LLG14_11300, partial [Nocardiaceae bacterium]|nr:hypothetical protein [Nocardiaceae bacterium]
HTVPYFTLRATSLVNGGFDTDTTWSKNNWTISGGAARMSNNDGDLTQSSVMVVGDTYKSTIVVSSISGGSITVKFGSSGGQTPITTAGTYTFVGVCAGSTSFILAAAAGTTCVVESVTCDPQHVTQWSDISGYGRHLVQATAAAQPVYSATAGQGGRPGFTFNGSSHYLKATAFTWNQSALILFTAKAITASGGSRAMIDGNATGSAQIITDTVTGSNNRIYAGTNLAMAAPNVPSFDTWYAWEALFSGNNSGFALNGQARTTGAAGSGNPGGLTVGRAGGGGVAFAAECIYELICANADFTDAGERASAVSYLRSNGGV